MLYTGHTAVCAVLADETCRYINSGLWKGLQGLSLRPVWVVGIMCERDAVKQRR